MSRSPLSWNWRIRSGEMRVTASSAASRCWSFSGGHSGSGAIDPSVLSIGGWSSLRWMSLAPSSTAILRMAFRSMGRRGEESAGLVPRFRGAPAGAAAGGRGRARRSGCATSPVSSPAITRQTAGMRASSKAARGWRSSTSFAFHDVAAKRPSSACSCPRSPISSPRGSRRRQAGRRRAPRRCRRPRAGRRARPRRRRAGPGRAPRSSSAGSAAGGPAGRSARASSTPCSAQSRRRCARSRGPSAAQPPTP